MSNEFLVLDYILHNFIPSLIVPFILGILLIGLFTRFARNLNI